MSLINLQTGATAAEEAKSEQSEKIILELQTKIYKQDLLIKKLNDEANLLHSRNSSSETLQKEIDLLKSKLNESENDRRELSETVTRAENEIKNLQQELNRKNKEPPRVEYKCIAKCLDCKKSEYDSKAFDVSILKHKAKKAYEEADNQRKYFYSLVNNYNAEIDKRVEKIVKRKTCFQRLADWLEKFISAINSMVFFVPFLYAVGVTVLAIFRNDIVRNDFITVGKAIGRVFAAMFFGVKWLILKATGLSAYVENLTVQRILWWAILILMVLIIIALILTILSFLSFFAYCFYLRFRYKFDKTYLAAVLANLGIVTFCGDLIKAKISINLVGTYFIFLAAFTVLKFVTPIIIEKIRR